MTNLEILKPRIQKIITDFCEKKVIFDCISFSHSVLSIEDRKQIRHFLIRQIQSQKEHRTIEKITTQEKMNLVGELELQAKTDLIKERDLKSLLTIGTRPFHPLLAISISHCASEAAFVFAFQNKQESQLKKSSKGHKQVFESKRLSIGLDIEQSDRVSKKVALRVSQAEELKENPSACLLWVAKEASFKCFSEDKNTFLLSECHISDWKAKDGVKDCYSYKAKHKNQKAKGIAFKIPPFSIAYSQTKYISVV